MLRLQDRQRGAEVAERGFRELEGEVEKGVPVEDQVGDHGEGGGGDGGGEEQEGGARGDVEGVVGVEEGEGFGVEEGVDGEELGG